MFPQNQPAADNQGPTLQQQPPVASSADSFSSPNLRCDILRHPSPQHISEQGMIPVPQQNQPGAQTMFNGPFPELQVMVMHLRNTIRNVENAIATGQKANLNFPTNLRAMALPELAGKKDTLVKPLNNVLNTMYVCVSLLAFLHELILKSGKLNPVPDWGSCLGCSTSSSTSPLPHPSHASAFPLLDPSHGCFLF
jgi:hypothetical protein